MYHISIKGMSNFFPFPQSYRPKYSSRENHDLLVSYQTEQRLFVFVHHFLSQVAGLNVYVYTNLFSSTTLERLLPDISLDFSEPGNVVVAIMISDNINHQLLKTFVAFTIKLIHSHFKYYMAHSTILRALSPALVPSFFKFKYHASCDL